MIKDASSVHLDDLRSALHKFASLTLSPETRSAVQAALREIDDFDEYLESHREQERLAALYGVSRAIGATLDLDQVLPQVMDAVIKLTGAERGFLVLVEPGQENWELRAARNLEQESLARSDMEVSRTVIATVIQTGVGVVTTDARTDPRFARQDSVVIYALRSILCAPLLVRGVVIGVIYVDNRAQSGMFTPSDLQLLEAFAAQAAIAIENARLYTRTDQALAQRVVELETLAQIDRELNASLDLRLVVEIARNWSMKGTGASQAWIILTGEEQVDEPLASNPSPDAALSLIVPASFPFDDRVFDSFRAGRELPVSHQEGSLAYLLAPITHAGRLLGVTVVERQAPFSTAEVQFIGRLNSRAAAAIENARLYQAVQQANQAKTKFISVVTHELRIPMTSIKGYTDLLRQGMVGPVNEQQHSFLNVIRNNVERMSALVSDLSDISRIETGRLKLNISSFSIMAYVNETMVALKPKMDEKSQTLTLAIPEDLPQVSADPNRLVQILTNLISNAWKYTPEGGKVLVTAGRFQDFVRIEVVDSGIGISEEDQQQLFTQFFRSENPAVRDQQGWGLGLSVTRRLVELMGGLMGVESRLGEGSRFWFTLPVAVIAEPAG